MAPAFFATIEPLPLKTPSILSLPPRHLTQPSKLAPLKNPTLPLPLSLRTTAPPKPSSIRVISSASDVEIDMVRTKEGVYTPKPKKVVVLWDLDNKPPRGPPYQAAMALKKVAQSFGELADFSAYANRHAFIHLPHWVVEERRERRNLDILERKGVLTPSEPYICSVCGRKCKTHFDLKKHFKQLHERERQKKLNRMRQLKGKKRQRFKERFISGNNKYVEAARTVITPKVGYGLASELRRAGVFVKTVEDKPQAADWAVKRQMQHSMSRGIDWLFLVSDDSDFLEMMRKAREANLGTVVVGDWHRALGREADLWVPWAGVENGNIKEEDLLSKAERTSEFGGMSSGRYSVSEFDGGSSGEGNMDSVVNEVMGRNEFGAVRFSAFSEGEEEEDNEDEDQDEEDWLQGGGNSFENNEDSELDFLLDDEGEADQLYFF